MKLNKLKIGKIEVLQGFKDNLRTVSLDSGEVFILIEDFRTYEEAQLQKLESLEILEEGEQIHYIEFNNGKPALLSFTAAASQKEIDKVIEVYNLVTEGEKKNG